MKRTFQPKKRHRARVHGFRKRMIIARPAADGLEMAEVKKNLVHALKLAHLLKED